MATPKLKLPSAEAVSDRSNVQLWRKYRLRKPLKGFCEPSFGHQARR